MLPRDPYPSSGSVLTLFVAEAAPVALTINNTRAGIPSLIIVNSGVLRYSVFEGPFTKNDQLTAAPFADSFLYIPNVPADAANQVLPHLNSGSASKCSTMEKELWGRGRVEHRYRAWLEEMNKHQVPLAMNADDLTLGYVTKDASHRSLFTLASSLTRSCPSFLLTSLGLPRHWRRHAAHPGELLCGSRLYQLESARRDERDADRSRLYQLYRERCGENLKFGAERDNVYVGGRVIVHADTVERGAGPVRTGQVGLRGEIRMSELVTCSRCGDSGYSVAMFDDHALIRYEYRVQYRFRGQSESNTFVSATIKRGSVRLVRIGTMTRSDVLTRIGLSVK